MLSECIVPLLCKHVKLSRCCHFIERVASATWLVTRPLYSVPCVKTRRLFSLPPATSFLCHSSDTYLRCSLCRCHRERRAEMDFRHLPFQQYASELYTLPTVAILPMMRKKNFLFTGTETLFFRIVYLLASLLLQWVQLVD